MATRKCLGSNAKGEPCQAAPLVGQEYCSAHDRTVPDEHRFGSPEWSARAGASEKPRKKDWFEAYNELAVEHARVIFEKGIELLTATETRVSGTGDDAFAEQVPNHTVQLRAYIDFLDRLMGKPTDKLELTGEDGGPIQTQGTVDISDPEVNRLAHDLLRRRTQPD